MNKLKVKFLFPTCLLLILPNIQVLSQNHHLYRFIINKEEQLANIALVTLVNQELPDRKNKVKYKTLFLLGQQEGISHYLFIAIYFNQKLIQQKAEQVHLSKSRK